MFERDRYNYDAFERARWLKDMAISKFADAPSAGDRAPDFQGRTLDGDNIRLKDFRGDKNVVLTFGSATCPQTAGSLPGLNKLYRDRDDNVEHLFVYVREAHPGERIPAHDSDAAKHRAAERLRDDEEVDLPIVVDDLDGKIHRKFGRVPNATFLIDKSGRVAFRSLSTQPAVIAEALEELLEVQHDREVDHAVVRDGEDLSLPSLYSLVRANRALSRGGRRSVRNFRRQMGLPGRVVLASSRVAQPVLDNPGKTIASIVAGAAVIGAGIWVGLFLRRKRLSTYRSPYESRRRFRRDYPDDFGEYEAVGI